MNKNDSHLIFQSYRNCATYQLDIWFVFNTVYQQFCWKGSISLIMIYSEQSKKHYQLIGLVGRVFTNGLGDWGSIPGRIIPKTLKMVLDTSFLNTQQYKVCIKGKMEQSRERSSAPPLHLGVVAIEKGAFWSPSTMVANFTFFY